MIIGKFVRKHLVFAIIILYIGISFSGGISNDADDDLIFIHHSCGSNWLSNSLHGALLAKDYIDERNDITYGTDVLPDAGRPDSLAPKPGDNTNMNHWILWFNDYLDGVISHGCADGANRIIMFKSCYPFSNIGSDGTEPGDPFSSQRTLTNYKAVYRHPDGPGNVYNHNGYDYISLEDIFANNPDTLFIPVTAPPRHYAPSDATNDAEGHRARQFNNWLRNDWLDGYNNAHPELNNVAVFDWFDVLAYPDNDPYHPNRLKAEYGGESGNSHPNNAANSHSTQIFATNSDNFIDIKWNVFITGSEENEPPYVPTDPNPANGSTGVDVNIDLSWTGGDPNGDSVTYDIYLGTAPDAPKIVTDQSGATYDPGRLINDTQYYWKIVAWDSHDNSTTGPIWTFRTDVIANNPPNKPTIDGPTHGKAGAKYEYIISSVDPDDDNVTFRIYWGDDSGITSIGPYSSGEEVTVNHTWSKQGTYTIKAKAKDIHDAESELATLKVIMPKNKAFNPLFLRFLENHPCILSMLRDLLGL